MIIPLRFHADVAQDWQFDDALSDISNYVEDCSWHHGMNEPFRSVAAAAGMSLKLHNNGDLDIYDSSALYYDKLRIGTLIRVQAWDSSAGDYVTMAVMKIVDQTPRIEGLDKKLFIECTDILKKFLDAEYVAPLQTGVRIDEALLALHQTDKAIYPYPSYYAFIEFNSVEDGTGPFDGSEFVDFEEAETLLPFVGDNMGRENKMRISTYVRDCVDAEINALYFFDCRSETFKFFNRNHATEAETLWTLVDSFEASYCKPNKYMVNEYTVNFYPRAIGAEGSVLFESDSVPFAIPAKDTREITIRYRDPDNPSAAVGALEVLDPVIGVDIIANSAEDGSGEDWSRFIIASFVGQKGAASSKLSLYNRKVGDPAYITQLRINGTPITIFNKESLTERNIDSIYRHENIPEQKNLYAVSDQDTAQAYARFMVDSFGEPSELIERVKVIATLANREQIINRTIGDVIRLVDSQKNHDDIYMIVGEEHRPNARNSQYEVTYIVRSVGRGKLFTLGASTYDEGDVLGL
jgi:hypothetical protein